MEIKVIHTCGTKFAFDVEPENGAMPFAIQCPSCGQDATEDANAIIARALSATPAAAPPPPPPPPPAPKPGLALGRSHAPESRPATPPPPPASPAATADKALKPTKKSGSFTSDEAHIPLGIAGAFVGAALGMGIWFAMVHFLHFASGWIAWGIGVMAGYGARLLGRAPAMLLGFAAAAFTLLAIIGGTLLATLATRESIANEAVEGGYEHDVAFAKKVAGAKDDAALRAVLQADMGKDDEVTDADVARVKSDLPRLKELADGKPAKQEYEKKKRDEFIEGTPLWVFIGARFGIFTIIFVFLGIGSAFKIGSGTGS